MEIPQPLWAPISAFDLPPGDFFLLLICNQDCLIATCVCFFLSFAERFGPCLCSNTCWEVADCSKSSPWLALLETLLIQCSLSLLLNSLLQLCDHCGGLPWIHSSQCSYAGVTFGKAGLRFLPVQRWHSTRRQDSLFLILTSSENLETALKIYHPFSTEAWPCC